MGLWVDGVVSSHDETSKQLVELLGRLLNKKDEIWATLGTVPKIKLLDIQQPEPFTARLFWASAVLELRRQRCLQALIEVTAARFPPERDQLVAFLMIESVGTPVTSSGLPPWKRFEDPLDARFVGPGLMLPLFDRDPVRTDLELLRDQGFRTLNIAGEARTGKTFTLQLVQLVCAELGVSPALVDVADWGTSELTDLDLVATLTSQLGIEIDPHIVDHAPDPQTRARLLGHAFRDRLSPTKERPLWIVIDGLDRPNVKPEARAFVERLLKSVEVDGKPANTKLVLTGFDGTMPTTSRTGQMQAITDSDVDRLFQAIADHLPAGLDDVTRAAWVAEAMQVYAAEEHDLAALGDAVLGRLAALDAGGG